MKRVAASLKDEYVGIVRDSDLCQIAALHPALGGGFGFVEVPEHGDATPQHRLAQLWRKWVFIVGEVRPEVTQAQLRASDCSIQHVGHRLAERTR